MNENPVREVATLIDANGVRVVEFELAPNASGAWHHHSRMSEHCYCLTGRLTIEVAGHAPVSLNAGERCEIPTGINHRVRNEDEQACGFLVVQGVGAYDFIQPEDLP